MNIFEKFIKKWDIKRENIMELGNIIIINCTPHELKFTNNAVLQGNQELAKILKVSPKEQTVKVIGNIKLVTTEFEKEEKALELIHDAKSIKDKTILLVSSILSANTYGFPVVSPVTTPETSRAPPNQRIVYHNKFNTALK